MFQSITREMFQFLTTIILIVQLVGCTPPPHRPLVQLHNDDFEARIVGVEKLNYLNETYQAFLGIPYARPPIANLRFEDPQKLDKFEGTFHAIHEGYECHSIMALNASEDCLNLNVYTKKLLTVQSLRPVLVVIHPGGFYLGSTQQLLEPSYMMTKDIILVTFNYRLGALGFLNLGTQEVAGNAGLKDQVYALRWVQQNIKAFGGNPKDVTLMGYSAGALSVSLHLVSSMSKGLFHKAIIMSGSMPPQTKMPQGHQKYLAIRQAKRLNCSRFKQEEEALWLNGKMITDYSHIKDTDILECLQQFEGSEIAKTLRQMFDFGKDNPIYLWLPIQEEDFGQEIFLKTDFYANLNTLDTLETPLLIGYTNGEFCTSAKDILSDSQLKLQFENEFEKLAPRIFMYESQGEKSSEITRQITNFYLNNSKTLSLSLYDSLCDLFSDAIIRFGSHRMADIVAAKGSKEVSFYEFRFQGREGKYAQEELSFSNDRVEHMDDFQYLFNWSKRDSLSPAEKKMVDLYTEFIYEFVQNGKILSSHVTAYPDSLIVLDQNGLHIESNRYFENYKFWSDLLEDQLIKHEKPMKQIIKVEK